MLEAILESVSLYRESVLASPEVQAGEAALAERAYRSSLAQGVQSMSRRLASGLLVSGWGCLLGEPAKLSQGRLPARLACAVRDAAHGMPITLQASATYASAAMSKTASGMASGQPAAAPVTISPGMKKR
jgi:hypothetical protein